MAQRNEIYQALDIQTVLASRIHSLLIVMEFVEFKEYRMSAYIQLPVY